MTPPALDRDVVHAKLRALRELLDDLDAGINNHLVAARLGKGAPGYRESFLMAAQAGALPQELAERLVPSAGLRNVLVHEYVDVDLDQVVTAVALARTDYRSYVRAIADALTP